MRASGGWRKMILANGRRIALIPATALHEWQIPAGRDWPARNGVLTEIGWYVGKIAL